MKATIKNKDTAEEAAIRTLRLRDERITAAASEELGEFIKKWEVKHGTNIICHFRGSGNQCETTLQVIIKPK